MGTATWLAIILACAFEADCSRPIEANSRAQPKARSLCFVPSHKTCHETEIMAVFSVSLHKNVAKAPKLSRETEILPVFSVSLT